MQLFYYLQQPERKTFREPEDCIDQEKEAPDFYARPDYNCVEDLRLAMNGILPKIAVIKTQLHREEKVACTRLQRQRVSGTNSNFFVAGLIKNTEFVNCLP